MAKRGVTEFLKAFGDDHVVFFRAETDLLIALDEQGNIARVNPAFEKALEREESNVLHHEVIQFVHEDDLAKFIRSFDQSHAPDPIRLLKRNNGEIVARLIAFRFRRTDDGLRGYLILRPE